jgi:hypothetical protein
MPVMLKQLTIARNWHENLALRFSVKITDPYQLTLHDIKFVVEQFISDPAVDEITPTQMRPQGEQDKIIEELNVRFPY